MYWCLAMCIKGIITRKVRNKIIGVISSEKYQDFTNVNTHQQVEAVNRLSIVADSRSFNRLFMGLGSRG